MIPDQDTTSRSTAQESKSLLSLLTGAGLSRKFLGLFLILISLLTFTNFQRYYNKPMKTIGEHYLYYAPMIQYQYRDAPVWVATGALLPTKAPEVRAMRPLYPAYITICKWLGIFSVDPKIYNVPMGEVPSYSLFDLHRGIKLYLGLNCVLMPVALWIFFCLCRRFGMDQFSALMASLCAGGAYGFSFWVSQAIPEVFCYFLMVVTLALIVIATETEVAQKGRVSSVNRRAAGSIMIWAFVGLIVGVFLLGKELYSFPLFIGLFLLFRKKWIQLIAFSLVVMLPVIAWNFYVIHYLKAYDPSKYLTTWGFIVWIQKDLLPASWPQKLALIWGNIRYQQVCFALAFGWWIVTWFLIGIIRTAVLHRRDSTRFPHLWLILFAYFGSFFIMFFVSNMILPRIMFIMWPMVFYFAWLGMDYALNLACSFILNEQLRSWAYRSAQIAAVGIQIYLGSHQIPVIKDIYGAIMLA